MSSGADDIYEGLGEAFDELRAELLTVDEDAPTLKMLKKYLETDTYEVLLDIPSAWYVDDEEFRQQTRLRVARKDATFINAFNEMTDFAFNDIIYNVDREDKRLPVGKNFYFTAYGNLEQNNAVLTEERIYEPE